MKTFLIWWIRFFYIISDKTIDFPNMLEYILKIHIFLKEERLAFPTVYINILLKLICYEIWWGQLEKYKNFIFKFAHS